MSWWSVGTALVICCLVGGAGYFFGSRRPPIPLPGAWRVEPRPVLSSGERLAMSLLREALPHNVVLAKLPLVRLCQPIDADRLRYWFDLIGPVYVSFAICSVNGRVLAVIDIEAGGPHSARVARIKRGVLDACRIRYVRCRADRFPAPSELALLLRPQGPTARLAPLAPSAAAPTTPLPQAPNFQRARGTLSDTVKTRRAERSARWADSTFAQDSFFGPNSRADRAANSEFPPSAADEAPPPQGQAAIR